MRYVGMVLVLACAVTLLPAQENMEGPTNEKAQKTYKEALELLQKHMTQWALDSFKKADKQDGGRCVACQRKMVSPQHEKFLFPQNRKFRFDRAWRNQERGCGCRRKIESG